MARGWGVLFGWAVVTAVVVTVGAAVVVAVVVVVLVATIASERPPWAWRVADSPYLGS